MHSVLVYMHCFFVFERGIHVFVYVYTGSTVSSFLPARPQMSPLYEVEFCTLLSHQAGIETSQPSGRWSMLVQNWPDTYALIAECSLWCHLKLHLCMCWNWLPIHNTSGPSAGLESGPALRMYASPCHWVHGTKVVFQRLTSFEFTPFSYDPPLWLLIFHSSGSCLQQPTLCCHTTFFR